MNKEKENTKVILCMYCGNKTSMEEVARYTKKIPDYIELETGVFYPIGDYLKTWKIYLCPTCDQVTLMLNESADFDNQFSTNIQLFPQTSLKFLGVPDKILKAFEAALKCRHLDGAMCAIGLRRTLEIICKEYGETGYGIERKLENLSKKGILPPHLREVAFTLKDVGNEAAHGDDYDFPEEIINSLIEFTDNIIKYLYVLPHNLKCIQEKIEKRRKTENDLKE